MRLIDADALMEALGINNMDCRKCRWYEKAWSRCRRGADFSDACFTIEHMPTIEERKTGDLISRQAAIDALTSMAGAGNRALDKIRSLPSAQPDRR